MKNTTAKKTAENMERIQMPPVNPGKITLLLIPLFVFLWPAIYLCRDILPIRGTYTAITNDFGGLYYCSKAYLLASLAQNHFPLWCPSEAAGFPFFSNPFAQVFYPPNLVLIPFYALAGGYTLLDHQIFTILGLCVFSLGLYAWLGLIIPNHRAVILSVLIMSVSFKMTEMVRFPNAVHTAAWYPWILFAITKLFLSKTGKQSILNAGLLVFSVVCLCTAGYPYYIYYSLFLFPVYFGIFLWPFLRRQLFGYREFQIKRGIIGTVTAGIIAACICVPYLAAVAGLMSQTVDRGGKNFAYSTSYIFNLPDTLGSLIYPPLAQAEGWYFFSIAAFLIILIYIFSFPRMGQVKISRSKTLPSTHLQSTSAATMLFLIIWMAIVSYISYGKDSELFKLLWHIMPGFSSLRVWGRLNIILIPLIAWLLSLSYSFFETLLYDTDEVSRKNRIRAILTMSIGYIIIVIVQYRLYNDNIVDPYWKYFPNLSGCRIYFIIFGFTGYLTVLLLIYLRRLFYRSVLRYAMPVFFLLLAAVVEMWPAGANTWVEKNVPVPKRNAINITENNLHSFTTPRLPYGGVVSLSPAFTVSILRNWDFSRYVDFLKRTQNEGRALAILLGTTENPQKIYISQSLQHKTVQSFLTDSLRFKQTGQLLSYTGDELVWELDMPVHGFLSFIDNWDPYWKAYVDKKETPVELLFGTFKSIPLTPGKHRVIFRYEPTLKAILLGTK
jgi:hypothetical protein